MTDTRVTKDPDNLTMTVASSLAASVERAWRLWEDPRKLERWWGPPACPATFVEHDLTPGGRCTYYMTGPDGDQPHGWWRILHVKAPRMLELEDGFADEAGNPVEDLPTTNMRVTLDPDGDGTAMTITSTFPSLEAMQQLIDMGMEEGILAAAAQIDAILAEDD